jgi:hypothetical protein
MKTDQSYVTVGAFAELRSVQLSRHQLGDELDIWIQTSGGFSISLCLRDAIWLSTALPRILAAADETVSAEVGMLAELHPGGEVVRFPGVTKSAGGSSEPGGER